LYEFTIFWLLHHSTVTALMELENWK